MSNSELSISYLILIVLTWVSYLFQGGPLVSTIEITVILVALYLFGIWLTNWLK